MEMEHAFGFIGVGRMGGGLARNLIKAGKEVLVFDLSAEAVQKTIAAGKTGKAVKEIKEMAGADVVFTSLPLPQDVEGVMLGEKGIAEPDEARIHLYRCQHDRPENRAESFPRRRKPERSNSWNVLWERPRPTRKRPKSRFSPAGKRKFMKR